LQSGEGKRIKRNSGRGGGKENRSGSRLLGEPTNQKEDGGAFSTTYQNATNGKNVPLTSGKTPAIQWRLGGLYKTQKVDIRGVKPKKRKKNQRNWMSRGTVLRCTTSKKAGERKNCAADLKGANLGGKRGALALKTDSG